MNIPDEAVDAAAMMLAGGTFHDPERLWSKLRETARDAYRQEAKAALSAALPAIERAHLEQLAAEAPAEWQEQAPHFPSAGLPYRWLRPRLDQTKEKP